MEYFLVMVFFWQIFKVHIVQGQYYVTNEAVQFSKAPCTLAQPPLKQTHENITFKDLKNVNVENNEQIWVGYIRGIGVFNYRGCVRENNTGKTSDFGLVEISPGSCYSVCGSAFGLTTEKCYCFQNGLPETSYIKENYCIQTCTNQTNVLCGGKQDNTEYISLYTYAEKESDDVALLRYCRIWEPSVQKLLWYDCAQNLRTMCIFDNGIYGFEHFCNWKDCVQQCIEKGSLPTIHNSAYGQLKHFDNGLVISGGSELWTGAIASRSILRTTGAALAAHEMAGVLQKDGNKIVLSFTEKSGPFKALCSQTTSSSAETPTKSSETATTSLETTSTKTEPSALTSLSSLTTLSAEPFATTTRSTTTAVEQSSSQLPNMQTIQNLEAEEQSKDIGVSVGVSIAVVLVVGIVIVVVVILKRRNIICVQKPDKEYVTHEPQEQNDYSEIPETALTNGKVEYTNSKKMKNLEHTYHRVEKQGAGEFDNRPESTYNHPDLDGFSKTRSNDQSEDLDPGHYAHTYFVLENQQNVDERDMNDTYNMTGDHKFTDHKESDNVYNKLDDNSNATYDHMHKFVPGAKSKDIEAENTYDTKDTVIKTGNTLTARGNQVYRNVGEADESDTYHHIGVKTSAATGNFYGAAENSSV